MIIKMKFLLSILLISALMIVGILGFNSMSHSGGHDAMASQDCFAAQVKGLVSCPQSLTFFGYIAFHLNVFSEFSKAVLSDILTILFLLFVAIVWILKVFSDIFKPEPALPRQYFQNTSLASKDKFVVWFSLLENSPSSY